LAADRVEDVEIDADLGLGYANEIEAAAKGENGQALFGHGFHADEIEHMVRPSGQESADGFDRIVLR